MSGARHILAIDQGTTSSRAIVFDGGMHIAAQAQHEFAQLFPQPGWVEHDPETIWQSVMKSVRDALALANLEPNEIAGIGITNQRETVVIWDRTTGEPIHNAIVWQDRRTSDLCAQLKEDGAADLVRDRTGLIIDPYFSATKIAWLLDNVSGARARAEAGELLAGTIDSYLVWRLTGGRRHVTDATNAARTMLFDIMRQDWDDDLIRLFRVSAKILPQVLDCAAEFGSTEPTIFGAAVPILGVAGDQQAATIGQACFEPGMLKATYGTGCFAVLNTGDRLVRSRHRLLGTIAYRLDGRTSYALEGSIFVAGAAVQWLRDGIGIIDAASEMDALAESADETANTYLVPAFTGLGAPYWDAEARGAIFGLTRGTGRAELARAALDAVVLQTLDLVQAMAKDVGGDLVIGRLRVDGGMVASNWTMQRLADVLDAPVDRPVVREATSLGAAWLAGYRAGFYPAMDGFARSWKLDRSFTPLMKEDARARLVHGWRDAVSRTLATR